VALLYNGGSQTCSSRYPKQGSDYVLLLRCKKFSVTTQHLFLDCCNKSCTT